MFLLSLLAARVGNLSGQSVSLTSISPQIPQAADSSTITFSASGFSGGNTFTLQLRNLDGTLRNNLKTGIFAGTHKVRIPGRTDGGSYKLVALASQNSNPYLLDTVDIDGILKIKRIIYSADTSIAPFILQQSAGQILEYSLNTKFMVDSSFGSCFCEAFLEYQDTAGNYANATYSGQVGTVGGLYAIEGIDVINSYSTNAFFSGPLFLFQDFVNSNPNGIDPGIYRSGTNQVRLKIAGGSGSFVLTSRAKPALIDFAEISQSPLCVGSTANLTSSLTPPSGIRYSHRWYRNDTLLADSSQTLSVTKEANYKHKIQGYFNGQPISWPYTSQRDISHSNT